MIDQDTVFLVSGGARGITADCVIELARQYHCKFILAGRSDISESEPAWAANCFDEATLKKQAMAALQAKGERPKPADVQRLYRRIVARREVLATLQTIQQTGSQAEYISVDITDLGQLQRRLAEIGEQFGLITGLIHGAGVLADKPIERKTAEDFDRVYGVKVLGLQNLLTCVSPQQLRHLILFSSAAGFYGNVGQTDYALANEVLNKMAHQIKRSYPNCQVLAFNWGPWDGGMVTPQLRQYFTQHKVDLIPIDAGTRLLADKVDTPSEAVQLVIGSSMASPATILDDTLRTYRIHRVLSEAANPFLQDHVIGQHAVLPTVCGVNWVVNSAEQLYPDYHFVALENFKVLKGIVFDDSLAEAYVLDLKELSKSEAEVVFEAVISSKSKSGAMRYHYKTQLMLRRDVPTPAQISIDAYLSNPSVLTAAELYQPDMLFHGPSFRGVEKVLEISPERLVLQGNLPLLTEIQQGQFPVQRFNPYIADVQFQSLVIWARYFYQAASLPLTCRAGEQHQPLHFGEPFYVIMDVQSSTESNLVANLTTCSQAGQICTRLMGAEVTISQQLNPLFRGQAAL